MPASRRRILGHVVTELRARMGRTKTLGADVMETPLSRCLTTFDITLLGIGHMVGAGIYVLAGPVARDVAGPGVVLSFLLAGFTSLLAALCYAEFGARVPKAGSAYVYAYVSLGEIWAFIIGWNIILEHMIGAASVARAWSGALDALAGGAVTNWTAEALGSYGEPMMGPPDLLAAGITIVCALALAAGAKVSAAVNAGFTAVNVLVILLVVGVGFYSARLENWTDHGFLPFGFSGVLAGAATAFYAFVGFDSIATAGEEARSPATSIPAATLISMLLVTVLYVLVSGALTLMQPYYKVSTSAALPEAVASQGLDWARWAVSLGALAGMTTTLLGSLFALPRTIYAMAMDGLLFEWLARVNPKTQVPLGTLAVAGVCSAVLALVVDLKILVEFMSIGTLLAYTLVSAAVVVLRYRPPPPPSAAPRVTGQPPASAAAAAFAAASASATDDSSQSGLDMSSPQSEGGLLPAVGEEDLGGPGRLRPGWRWMRGAGVGGGAPGAAPAGAVALFVLLSAALCALVQLAGDDLLAGSVCPAVFVAVFSVGMMLCLMVIWGHRQVSRGDRFRVPLVPFVPALSILCNIALMMHLTILTWARFVVWMVVGLLVYYLYGIRHSREGDAAGTYAMLLTSPEAGKGAWGSIQQHQSDARVTDKTPIVPEEEITQ